MAFANAFRFPRIGLATIIVVVTATIGKAQLSGPPTANCHVTDGQFTACPNAKTEWSDVQPLAFPSSDSYLYVNQDAAHAFLYLMYDLPLRTTPLAANDSVHINFDTVETLAGSPALVVYDISIFGDGQMQVLQQGQPTPPGHIVGAAGFGTSPKSSTPHVMAELQVPLSAGPPSTYSPDPLFWGASIPPTNPPPPPPPSCPVTVLGVCVKSQGQIDAWTQQSDATLDQAELLYTNGLIDCDNFGQQAQAGADAAAQAALANATSLYDAQLNIVAGAANQLSNILTPKGGPPLAQIAPAVVPSVLQAINALQNLVALAPIDEPDLYLTVNLNALIAAQAAVRATLGAAQAAEAAAAAGSALVAEELVPLAAALGVAVAAFDAGVALEVVFAEAVQAVAQAAATGACLAALDLVTAPYFAKAAYYELLAEDPPDPNFTVVATPVVPSLPGQPLTTATGFSQQVINDLNSLLLNSEQEIALLQVIPVSVNRVAGAVAAGNQLWQQKQAQAVQQYASQLIPLVNNETSRRAALAKDLATSGLGSTFTSNDVFNFLGPLQQNGLPSGVTATLTQLGVDAATQAIVLSLAKSTTPDAVAALGSGAFLQALSDPSLASTDNATVTALSELAGENSALGKNNIFLIGTDAVSFHGDSIFASQLWAHLGPKVAYINNFGVSGATSVDGQPVAGFASVPSSLTGFSALFFASPDRCCLDPSTVPSLGIASNASAIASFLSGGGNLAVENFQGASTWDSILGFTSASGVIYGAPSPGGTDPGVSTLAGVAAGFTGNSAGPNRYVEGSFVHQAYSDSFFASQGFTSLIDASSLASGSGVLLAKGLTAGTGGTPLTNVTAAVVEANGNGETVINLRGLAPTDAPTLQDQIQMIVQSRVIKNPSLSASQLTTQLVNSLPPSVLPAGQAQEIINAVTSALVPPPPVISGMPGSGCSLWPPNGKLVQVATVTAADAVGDLLPGSFKVTGSSNETSSDPSNPEIVITSNGSGGYVVQLQAARLGTGTGRVYTITATASNSVGIATTSTGTCVVPHDQGH